MLSVTQLLVVVSVYLPVIYSGAGMAGAHVPLRDDTLSWLDARLFRYDSASASQWVASWPALESLYVFAYSSIVPQALVLLALGSLLRPGERNAELIWLALVSLTLTMAIFAFTRRSVPAGHIGSGHIDLLKQIRSGHWSILSYSHSEGIVNFASFHTTLALLYIYLAGRLSKWLLFAFVPLNAIMLLSIPVVGGRPLSR